jgi:hypothetical protein
MKGITQQEETVGLQSVLENVADVLTDSIYPESVRIGKALALISAARKDVEDTAVPSITAQRYRKLRAELEFSPFHMGLIRRRGEFHLIEGRFDAAVDALPDPNGKKQSPTIYGGQSSAGEDAKAMTLAGYDRLLHER